MLKLLFGLALGVLGLFLILLVLVQRGRGGGLTGALGGMGGQSAFGTRAGDVFTRVTIGVAAAWIILSIAAVKFLTTEQSVFGSPTDAESSVEGSGKSTGGEGSGTAPAGNLPAEQAPGGSAPASPAGETNK